MGLIQKIVEYLAAIDDGEVSVAELHVACILPRGQKVSHDDRFKARLHHPLHAKPLGDSIQFIQPEASRRRLYASTMLPVPSSTREPGSGTG
jgi:hypothetical protein